MYAYVQDWSDRNKYSMLDDEEDGGRDGDDNHASSAALADED